MLFNKHNFAIAALAASEESRFTLNGILVTPTETVVTDGHALIRVSTPSALEADPDAFPVWRSGDYQRSTKLPETFPPFVLPTKNCREIAKAIPAKSTIPVLKHAAVLQVEMKQDPHNPDVQHPSAATFITNDADAVSSRVFTAQVPEGRFPDYERVIPPIENYDVSTCFNPALLSKVIDRFTSFLEEDAGAGIRIYFERSGVVGLTIEGENRTTGQIMKAVVMPMKDLTAHEYNKLRREAHKVRIQQRVDEAVALRIEELERTGKIRVVKPKPEPVREVALDITPGPKALEEIVSGKSKKKTKTVTKSTR